MKLGHIEILSSNPAHLAKQYIDDLKFDLEEQQGYQFFWLLKDGCSFLIRPHYEGDDDKFRLVFYSKDLNKDSKILEQKGHALHTADDNCLHFNDATGNWLQLVDPGQDHSS